MKETNTLPVAKLSLRYHIFCMPAKRIAENWPWNHYGGRIPRIDRDDRTTDGWKGNKAWQSLVPLQGNNDASVLQSARLVHHIVQCSQAFTLASYSFHRHCLLSILFSYLYAGKVIVSDDFRYFEITIYLQNCPLSYISDWIRRIEPAV